jgi:hypothetical protein
MQALAVQERIVTETEWNSCNDPQLMLEFLRDRGASERKRRLAGCACASRVVPRLKDPRFASLVAAAERSADGGGEEGEVAALLARISRDGSVEIPQGQLDGMTGVAFAAHPPSKRHYVTAFGWLANAAAWDAAPGAAIDPDDWASPHDPAWTGAWADERASQAAVLREIFGNPFRVVSFDPSWRSENVVLMAGAMYESRDFSPMAVFADALEEAGCQNEELLEHCRGPGPHVRGCHVVDLALGRT